MLERCGEYDSAVLGAALGTELKLVASEVDDWCGLMLTCAWLDTNATRPAFPVLQVVYHLGETESLKEEAASCRDMDNKLVKLDGVGKGAFLCIEKRDNSKAAAVLVDVENDRVEISDQQFAVDADVETITTAMATIAEHVVAATKAMPRLTTATIEADPLHPRQLLRVPLDQAQALSGIKGEPQSAGFAVWPVSGIQSASLDWYNDSDKKPRRLSVDASQSPPAYTPDGLVEVSGIGDAATFYVEETEASEWSGATRDLGLNVRVGGTHWSIGLTQPLAEPDATEQLKEFAKALLAIHQG